MVGGAGGHGKRPRFFSCSTLVFTYSGLKCEDVNSTREARMPRNKVLVVGCDLDGVLGDIVQQVVRFSRREHQISMTRGHVISENIETCAPIRREQLHDLFRNREFFRSLPLVPHARQMLSNLKELGWKIHIVTDRFWYDGIHADTKQWLMRHRIPFDSVVFARKEEKHDVVAKLGIGWFIEDQL